MKLHLDRDAFDVFIENIHERCSYRSDVLEKDYYVVLILEELAKFQKENGLPAYFKGGTALYKALKMTNRFSEDIDLSVDTREMSRSQNDKKLSESTKKYTVLPREDGITHRSEVITTYIYEPVTNYDTDDSLQRFGRVKIEATSFTIGEPVTSMEIAPLIYELATEEERRILESQYDIKPFGIKTITMERIFVDKLFAAESYVRKSESEHRAFEAAKHIYDLTVMENQPKIAALLQNEEELKKLLAIRLTEEKERRDGISDVLPGDFTFFTQAAQDKNVCDAYEKMLRQYVMRNEDRINLAEVNSSLGRIEAKLLKNPAWLECKLPKKVKNKEQEC